MKKITLNNGIEIPVVGLGTWKSTDDEVHNAVVHALQNGYTHIDTAAVYGNEEEVGKAWKASGVKREDFFLTTKIWNDVATFEGTKAAFKTSLEKLQTDYVDLILVHWPGSYERFVAVYQALEELYAEGKARAIGVSNFNVHHLNELFRTCKVVPAVNQVECHVKYQNQFLQAFCKEHGIFLQAYAPMMSWKVKDLAADETLVELGKKYGKSATQVALRALIERDIIVLPKSVNLARLDQNVDLFDFELSAEDMGKIRYLNEGTRLFIEPDNMDFGFLK
ncbi:aldo/keto reductase [Persicobacter psychrovividus]|uniref:Glyoxal reductase n=1 Tax=Persicobacter psychrovividus TaxID=387638 RepID=A0ABN6LF48_9BACT|nr:glyoxal reductase [Persicobacter psychrovividus]